MQGAGAAVRGPQLQQWPALRRLILWDATLKGDWGPCFAGCCLPELTQLELRNTRVGDDIAAALAAGHLPKLRSLKLANSAVTVQALHHLAYGRWPLLTSLGVSHPSYERGYCSEQQRREYKQHQYDPLFRSNWPLLERLCADGWGCIHLFTADQHSRWSKLKILKTSHVAFAPKAVLPSLKEAHLELIPRLEGLQGLQSLLMMRLPALERLTACVAVKCNYVTAEQIAAQQHWPQLTRLSLSDSNIGLESMLPLRGLTWPALKQLELSNSCIDATGMGDLAACELPSLEYIDLAWNNIDHDAMRHLSQVRWPLLYALNLNGSDMCPAATQCLVSAALPQLSDLQLQECGLTAGTFCILLKGKWPKLIYLELDDKDTLSRSNVVAACNGSLQRGDCSFEHVLHALLEMYPDVKGTAWEFTVWDSSITIRATMPRAHTIV